jgi:hypothetical protein
LIKIRYADLPAGLHVRAEAQGRSTIVYLLPGLTPLERRAALVRVRRNASLGHGPRLPGTGIAVAVMVDSVKATLRNGTVAFRAHPLLLLPPVVTAVIATLVYIMLAAVTITISPPQASGPRAQPGAVPGTHHHRRSGPPVRHGRIGNSPGQVRVAGRPADRPGRLARNARLAIRRPRRRPPPHRSPLRFRPLHHRRVPLICISPKSFGLPVTQNSSGSWSVDHTGDRLGAIQQPERRPLAYLEPPGASDTEGFAQVRVIGDEHGGLAVASTGIEDQVGSECDMEPFSSVLLNPSMYTFVRFKRCLRRRVAAGRRSRPVRAPRSRRSRHRHPRPLPRPLPRRRRHRHRRPANPACSSAHSGCASSCSPPPVARRLPPAARRNAKDPGAGSLQASRKTVQDVCRRGAAHCVASVRLGAGAAGQRE